MYKIAFKHGFIVFNYTDTGMIIKSDKGMGDLLPLDLKLDAVILNITNWYMTVIDILRNRYEHKAEFRIPQEDFHMELIPFGIKGEAQLKIVHEQKKQGFTFKVSRRNLYVFKEMFEEIDKIFEIGKTILQKEGENTYIASLLLPFQVKKNLRYLLKNYIYNGILEPYFFTWEDGRVEIKGNKLRIFHKEKDNFYLKGSITLDKRNAIKTLLVV